MKKTLLLFITLISIQYIATSQITQTYSQTNYTSFYIGTQPETSSSIRAQYLNEDWEGGSLQTKDGNIISNVFFRYNLTYGRFEMRFVINPKTVERIYSDGKVYIYSNFIEDKKVDSGYFELLNEGHSSLMVRYYFKEIPGRKGAFGHESYQQVFTSYYIKYGDNLPKKIRLRKKSIISSLPDKQELVKQYIKSEKLNLRFKADIIQLLKYYDSL